MLFHRHPRRIHFVITFEVKDILSFFLKEYDSD